MAVVMRPGPRTLGREGRGGGSQISSRHLPGLLILDESIHMHYLVQLLKEPATKAAFNLIHINLLVLCYGLDSQTILALLQALLCLVAA